MPPASGNSQPMKASAPRKGHEYSWSEVAAWLSRAAAFQNPAPAQRSAFNHHAEFSQMPPQFAASTGPHPDRLRSPEAVWKSEASSGDRHANLPVSGGLSIRSNPAAHLYKDGWHTQ